VRGLTAAQIVGRINHDAVKLGGKARLAAPVAEFRRQGGADVLRQILSLRPAAGKAVDKAEPGSNAG